MRLRLELRDGRQAGAARVSDLAAPFTLGTLPGATWQLRGEREAPDGQATLARSPDGTIMAEGIGSVTIGGRPIGTQAVPVAPGSVLTIAGRQVQLTLESTPVADGDFGLTAPSISAILSDVAPGGDAALGPLPGQQGEDHPLDNPAQHRPAASRFWQEPRAFESGEAPLPDGNRVILPADWAADAAGDVTNRSSQSAAPFVRTNVNPQTVPQPAPAAGHAGPDTAAQLARSEAALAQALAALARIEDDLHRHLADLGIAPPEHGEAARYAFHGQVAAGDDGALALRIGTILDMQQALMTASRATLAAALARLDPAAISAAATGGGLPGRLVPSAGYWNEYCARITPADGAPPLSEAALAAQVRRALGHSDDDQADQTKGDR